MRNFRDVTVRKKYEEQLQLMAHTLKSINESISITNTGNQILFVNDAFLKTYGYTHENELIGKNISIVRSLDNDPEFADKILKITTDTGWQGEILNRKKDGTEFPISLSTSVVQNEKGETLGMVGVAVDISERKQTEKALQESELKYRNLIETMPDGFYRSTPEGKFLEINEAMVKMLGYGSKEELLAVDIKTQLYFKPEDRESRVLQENPLELDVYPLKKKDGSAVWVEDHGWYVKDKAENIIYHEGVSRDITDRKTSEMQLQRYSEELQELNASKDKFFSIIAHDLKTPFNSILGFSEILKDEARNLDIETIEQYAGIINSTSKNTFRLLENLLDWARIQQSQILFRPVPVILNKLVGEVVEMLVENANSKLITIINHIPENLIIMADEDMLKTILRNLLSNALKFTSVNGKVEIKSASAVHSIEISVEDDGAGIKQEDIGKIFKIGAGFSKRGTGNEKGTGLGLMLCKEFVEKHGGKIWVKSEEGKGSTFTFSINENG
jgi:PAS domain S-box-containing protein